MVLISKSFIFLYITRFAYRYNLSRYTSTRMYVYIKLTDRHRTQQFKRRGTLKLVIEVSRKVRGSQENLGKY